VPLPGGVPRQLAAEVDQLPTANGVTRQTR
jgi:hypothetical protein